MVKDESARLIAKFLVDPVDGIEIGGVSDQLLDIIKSVTKRDRRLRRWVLDWLAYYEDSEDRYQEYRDLYDREFFLMDC